MCGELFADADAGHRLLLCKGLPCASKVLNAGLLAVNCLVPFVNEFERFSQKVLKNRLLFLLGILDHSDAKATEFNFSLAAEAGTLLADRAGSAEVLSVLVHNRLCGDAEAVVAPVLVGALPLEVRAADALQCDTGDGE